MLRNWRLKMFLIGRLIKKDILECFIFKMIKKNKNDPEMFGKGKIMPLV